MNHKILNNEDVDDLEAGFKKYLRLKKKIGECYLWISKSSERGNC